MKLSKLLKNYILYQQYRSKIKKNNSKIYKFINFRTLINYNYDKDLVKRKE